MDMYYMNGPYRRIMNENPDLPSVEIVKKYRDYLRSLSLVDTSPQNDVVGWIARRMTGERVLDAIVAVYGDRGNGKSYVCGYLGERVDIRLAHLTKKPVGTYFSIDNVRSVDKSGTLEMLTPKNMKDNPNQVYVLDDASIATNARNFNSAYNKNLNDIMTTARIYRCCIILNTVSSNMIDAVIRAYANIGVLVEGVIPDTTINKCKVFRMSQSNHMGFGKGAKDSIGKYFQITIKGEQHRMKTWYTTKPSDAWCKAYDDVRKRNTDNLGSNEESDERKGRQRATRDDMIARYYVPVIDACKKNTGKLNISGIGRELGISREWVNILLAEGKRRGEW